MDTWIISLWIVASFPLLAMTLLWNRRLKREVDERKKAEKSLRLTTAITEQSADSIICTDTEYAIRYINPATEALFGWRKEEVAGKTPDIFNVEPNRDEIQQAIYETVSSGKKYTGESLNIRKDGSVFYCQMSISALYDEKGEIYGYMGSQRDITPLKEAEIALRKARDELEKKVEERTAELSGALKRLSEKQIQLVHAERLSSLGEMAAGIAHEINQPLFIIRLCAESVQLLAKHANGLRPTFDEKVGLIIHSVDRASKIIDHVLDFARMRRGSPEQADPILPVENSLLFFREQFKQHGIALETEYEDGLPTVTIDPQRFEQVMVNFFSNARDAVNMQSESGPEDYRRRIHVRVFFDKAGKRIVYEVSDNGIGMKVEEKDKCLEPFFTTKEVGKGTGLGLSIAHGIIGECGGELEIVSQLGEGTTIRVLIPVSAEPCGQ